MTQTATGGAGSATNNSAPAAGSLFGVPKATTQPRLIPDSQNGSLALVPIQGSQANLPLTRFDQLDIVRGWKLPIVFTGTWTAGGGKTLTTSSFFPANIVQNISIKLQAAYFSINQTGVLAAIIQAFRPSWGSRGLGSLTADTFATFGGSTASSGSVTTETMNIDLPVSWYFDEYFDLDAQGNPARKLYDALVTPVFMAAQARTVSPVVTFAPQLTTLDNLGGPVTTASGDTTSTFTSGAVAGGMYRDAYWTANNPASNPPQFAWMYTRDYFTQPTSGQAQVNCLIQNTGVSLGQIMSLYGFTWDPQAASGLGAVVPFTSIGTFELVIGGSLQQIFINPQLLQDKMRRMYGATVANNLVTAGAFVFDFALQEDGGYISNAHCINTYLVNGVSLNIHYKSGSVPSATSTVYMGVEALKLATS